MLEHQLLLATPNALLSLHPSIQAVALFIALAIDAGLLKNNIWL
jgi:hypothetical protein